ncbi:hypothetical protein HNQ93_002854 [Hymenobacter luteus]|uniref:DUF3223 domain-containing protein n=2 Tax=Hymenobacter TaxID=89966 RepID=A0A7W9WBM7_9BACT|nr:MULTISPECIES: DUF3223 domain-containing protein [Hymenobacter]MBB4601578.1 hypothetical protein [Hymenobacter latericoloratus]MBB6059994.1 hypothetical protein [Hymenobacter luteus]
MRKSITIGKRSFLSKKEALLYYKNILNSYKFGQSLNDNDFDSLIALLDYDYQINTEKLDNSEKIDKAINNKCEDESEKLVVEDIIVSKAQFNTKCFEVVYSDNTSCYISYIMIINRKEYTHESLFNIACRNCIQKDLRKVKLEYFKNNSVQGRVKCQETNVLSRWEELVVDHRQPNTLSMIIDRFKEINNIFLENLEYQTDKNNLIMFKDQDLLQKFSLYHQAKATLRVVRKECNSSRSSMGRVKKNLKDLTIDQTQLPLF